MPAPGSSGIRFFLILKLSFRLAFGVCSRRCPRPAGAARSRSIGATGRPADPAKHRSGRSTGCMEPRTSPAVRPCTSIVVRDGRFPPTGGRSVARRSVNFVRIDGVGDSDQESAGDRAPERRAQSLKGYKGSQAPGPGRANRPDRLQSTPAGRRRSEPLDRCHRPAGRSGET